MSGRLPDFCGSEDPTEIASYLGDMHNYYLDIGIAYAEEHFDEYEDKFLLIRDGNTEAQNAMVTDYRCFDLSVDTGYVIASDLRSLIIEMENGYSPFEWIYYQKVRHILEDSTMDQYFVSQIIKTQQFLHNVDSLIVSNDDPIEGLIYEIEQLGNYVDDTDSPLCSYAYGVAVGSMEYHEGRATDSTQLFFVPVWVASDVVGAAMGAGGSAANDLLQGKDIDWGAAGSGALIGGVSFSLLAAWPPAGFAVRLPKNIIF